MWSSVKYCDIVVLLREEGKGRKNERWCEMRGIYKKKERNVIKNEIKGHIERREKLIKGGESHLTVHVT